MLPSVGAAMLSKPEISYSDPRGLRPSFDMLAGSEPEIPPINGGSGIEGEW
jgi:hypothetical protein